MAAEPRPARADGRASLQLLDEYRRLLVERMGKHFEFATAPDDERTARQFDPAEGGHWLVVEHGGRAVAYGGFRRFDDTTCEVKRMFVTADARVRLDTSEPLSESRRLYARAGYRAVDRYNDNQWADNWYEKEL